MIKNKLFIGFALASLVGVAACNGGDEDLVTDEATTTEVITETELEEREVTVPVQDTALVETTIERDIDVSVDTMDTGL